MNENEKNEMTEEVETVEESAAQATEDTKVEKEPRMYSEDEVNAIVGRKKARIEEKVRREYEEKYGELESVLKAGTKKDNVEDITKLFKSHYGSQGLRIKEDPKFSKKEIDILASADAKEIIGAGDDEVAEEVTRLSKLGDKMNERDKALFLILAEHRKKSERNAEFAKLGIPEEVSGSDEWQDFVSMFDSKTPVSKIYSIWNESHPKRKVETAGSMKHTASDDKGVKDFYSYEEAKKFTKADFDKNPELFAAVKRSMPKW